MECMVLREEMMEVLYGEADAGRLRRVEEHLSLCGSCREEMAALKRVRRDLLAWTLPDAPRGASPASWLRPLRVLAAAAVLLLALGTALGLSGWELRVGSPRGSFRLGRGDADLARTLAEHEARHRQEMEALKASLASARSSRDDEALLRRVEGLIERSEARQAVLLQASLAELSERGEAQRRYDLARVSAGLSYLDGQAGQQAARTTELVGYVLQASQQK